MDVMMHQLDRNLLQRHLYEEAHQLLTEAGAGTSVDDTMLKEL